jgi:hypothetical protein
MGMEAFSRGRGAALREKKRKAVTHLLAGKGRFGAHSEQHQNRSPAPEIDGRFCELMLLKTPGTLFTGQGVRRVRKENL